MLERCLQRFFIWFQKDNMKTDPDKFHFLLSNNDCNGIYACNERKAIFMYKIFYGF